MKKTLLLAAALACSGAAQAEAWFCEPTVDLFWLNGGYIQIETGYESITLNELSSAFDISTEKGIPLNLRLIMDTEKGVKVVDDVGTEIYEGDCQNMADGIRCIAESKDVAQTIWVLDTVTKIYSETFVSPTLIQSRKGACKEI